MLLQKCSGSFRCVLAKSNQVLFAACGESSVFALVKSSLDCRHVCLLESVLLLAGCCEGVFFTMEKILRSSPLYLLWWSLLLIVGTSVSWRVFFSWLDVVKERGFSYHRRWCPLWTSRSSYVSELISALLFSQKLLIWPLLMFLLSLGWICLVLKPNNPLFLLFGETLHDVLHSNSFQMQTTHWELWPA